MGYVLKAVLSSAQHPEYGQIIWESHTYNGALKESGGF